MVMYCTGYASTHVGIYSLKPQKFHEPQKAIMKQYIKLLKVAREKGKRKRLLAKLVNGYLMTYFKDEKLNVTFCIGVLSQHDTWTVISAPICLL